MMHFYPNKRVITQKRMVLLIVKAVSLRFLVQQRHISRAGAVFYDLLSNIHWLQFIKYSTVKRWNG